MLAQYIINIIHKHMFNEELTLAQVPNNILDVGPLLLHHHVEPVMWHEPVELRTILLSDL